MGIFGFLFDTENKFGKVMTWIGILVIANLMFILFSIPIFTAGASYTALYHVILKALRRKGQIKPAREFLLGFRSNFKQATICWIGTVIVFSIFYLELFWCRQLGGEFTFVGIAIASIAAVCFVILIFLFPTIAAFENTSWNLIKHAAYFCMKKPILSILMLAINIVPIAFTYMDEVNQPAYVFVWFFIGFATIAYLSGRILLIQFSQYLPPVDMLD